MIGQSLRSLSWTPLSGINNPNMPLYSALTGLLDGTPGDSGVTVTTTSAMRVMAVYAAVRLIAETIAALPGHVFDGEGANRVIVRAPGEAHVWAQPNPEMGLQTFYEQMIGSALLDGNAFAALERNRAGAVAEQWPLPPARVSINRTSTGARVFEMSSGRTLTDAEVFFVPAFSLAGEMRGLSPIGVARQAIGLSVAAERFGARFFGGGSIPAGLIQAKKALNAEQASALKARWRAMVSGAWDVAVLDADATFQQLTIPPEDAQFLETRKVQLSEIARLYRVPPHLIADVEKSTSWGTGIEEQNIAFVQFTLLPWIRRFEQGITAKLLTSGGRYFRWSLDGLLRGNTAQRTAAYTAGRNGGWLSINDIRRLEDLPLIPNGDDYLQPMNFSVVGAGPAALGAGLGTGNGGME